MLGSVPDDGTIVVADLEAGIGTLTRLDPQTIDVVLVVVEPTPRSIDVAQRAVVVAEEQRQGRIVVVANKVCSAEDLHRITTAFTGRALVVVPDDPAIDDADRCGSSPVDETPHALAVTAIEGLVEMVTPPDACGPSSPTTGGVQSM